MKNYIISLEDTEKNTAAPKAKVDVVKYLEELGFVNKYLKFETDSSLKSKIQKYFALKITVPSFFKKHRDMDALVLQYPLYSTVITKAIIDNARKYTNAKLYFVIHDLESLRLFRDNKEFIREEVGILNGSDGLVGHNDKMNEWLKDNGVNVPIANLEIFDYDNPQEIQSGYPYDGSLCFAGNLKKADFLNRLDIKHQLFLMGPNPQNNYGECISYEGQYTPEEVPAHLNHSFGLVWDGKSVDKCDGVFGEYMRYNNPHKVSLYLSSGIPVIIWKDAALADFVEKNKVGIAVESLEDVDSILDELSSEQYNEIKSNTQVIAEKMRSGYYIKNAIRQLIH